MVLTTQTDKIKIKLSSAITTNELFVVASWTAPNSVVPIDKSTTITNGTTFVDVVTMSTGDRNNKTVESMTVFNSDTVNAEVSVYIENAASDYLLYKKILSPGDTLQYTKDDGFFLGSEVANSVNNLLDRNNGTFDAFYRKRFSLPHTIFDSKQIGNKQPLFWDDQLTSGSGGATTYNANQASTALSVALNTAAVRVRQTFRRFNYQPGKSQLIIQTGIFGAAGAGIKRKAGLYDSRNGVFFDQQSDGMGVTIRTYTSGSAVDTRVLQADWNIDKMNGSGASGITLDFTKTLIWFCDFEWLGVGTVRFGFFVGGRPYYCHEVHNSNSSLLVYMSTPNLPLRYELENTGTGAAVGFTHICSTVVSEGGVTETGFPFGLARGATSLQTLNDSGIYPLISLRLNSSYLGSKITIGDFNIICNSTAAFNYYIILNPTVTGTALSFTPVTNSSIDAQVNTTNATKVSGGTVLHAGCSQAQNEGSVSDVLNSDFALGSNIAGTADVLVLAVQRVTGNLETFFGTLNIKDKQ